MIRPSFPLSTVAAVLPMIKGKGERVGEREEREEWIREKRKEMGRRKVGRIFLEKINIYLLMSSNLKFQHWACILFYFFRVLIFVKKIGSKFVLM